jgi:hypothetical protein
MATKCINPSNFDPFYSITELAPLFLVPTRQSPVSSCDKFRISKCFWRALKYVLAEAFSLGSKDKRDSYVLLSFR